MKKLILLLFITAQFNVKAQQFNFSFSQSTSVYTSLSEGVSLGADLQMHEKYNAPIGFSYSFLGQSFTSVSIHPMGFISFGDKNNFSFSVFENLYILKDSVQISNIKYNTSGNVGSRICKIEFSDFGCDNSGPDEKLNFQVWLYEQNNKIEFHCGASTINSASISESQLLLGPINRQQDSTPWAYLLNGNPASASGSLLTESEHQAALSDIPVSGTVYVFNVNQ